MPSELEVNGELHPALQIPSEYKYSPGRQGETQTLRTPLFST